LTYSLKLDDFTFKRSRDLIVPRNLFRMRACDDDAEDGDLCCQDAGWPSYTLPRTRVPTLRSLLERSIAASRSAFTDTRNALPLISTYAPVPALATPPTPVSATGNMISAATDTRSSVAKVRTITAVSASVIFLLTI